MEIQQLNDEQILDTVFNTANKWIETTCENSPNYNFQDLLQNSNNYRKEIERRMDRLDRFKRSIEKYINDTKLDANKIVGMGVLQLISEFEKNDMPKM